MSGATSFTSVPIVDIGGLHSPDRAQREQVAADIGKAAREIGFFYVSGTGIDDELFERMLAATKEFFALPLDEKMGSYIGLSKCHRGYVPAGEEGLATGMPEMKEAFDTALDLPGRRPRPSGGQPDAWPERMARTARVSPTMVTAYYDAVLDVRQRLLWAFAVALGERSDMFRRLVTKTPSQLRLIHYPYNPDVVDGEGIGAHTDYECFTLLKPTAPGLEVMNGAGEWIDVPPVPGTFVVNIGDMLELWTNGEFVATSHRVRKVAEERYSFPLFFNVDYHTEVKPLPQFVSRGSKSRPTLRAGEHLFAQTAQTFAYLRNRVESGDLVLPDGSLGVGQFGQQALQNRN